MKSTLSKADKVLKIGKIRLKLELKKPLTLEEKKFVEELLKPRK